MLLEALIREIDTCAEDCISVLSAVLAPVNLLGVGGWGGGGAVQHLTLSFSGNVSRLLEGFGSVGLSTITVTASVLDPLVYVHGVPPSAACVSSEPGLCFFSIQSFWVH